MWTRADYEKVIKTLGVPASLHYARPAADQPLSAVGFASLSKEDAVIINALGVSAKVITIMESEVTTRHPVKFDSITIGTEKYTIDTVNPVHLQGGQVVGFRCFCKGI